MLLPKTGQNLCYNTAGTLIACAGTGQDGDTQMGAAQTDPLFTDNGTTITDKVYGMTWQKDAGANGASIKTGIIGVPATRFTNNGNGTQTDNLTGLVWLMDRTCFSSPQFWESALSAAKTLASGSCSLTDGSVAGDWRLPNIDELVSVPTNWTGASPAAWLNTQGFINGQADYYWSSSTITTTIDKRYAWIVQLGGAYLGNGYKAYGYYVWPVRAGQSGTLGALTISKTGTGTGTVNSNPAGITCGAICSASVAKGQSVVLTATADVNSIFSSWTGCDSSNSNQCTVAVSGAKNVTAKFALTTPALTVNVTGTGNGTVSSTPDGITCLKKSGGTVTCSSGFTGDVTLSATPTVYSLFGGWSGTTCSGPGACGFAMEGDKSVNAEFKMLRIGEEYLTLQEVYDAAPEGAVIQLRQNTVAGVLTAGKSITVKLSGGYDPIYETAPGWTTVTVPLIISKGKVEVERIVVQ
jgi:hypothetical protein